MIRFTQAIDYLKFNFKLKNLNLFLKNFANGANETKKDFNEVLSSFPSFLLSEVENETIGYLSYGGMMAGDMEKLIGRWNQFTETINDGMQGSYNIIFIKFLLNYKFTKVVHWFCLMKKVTLLSFHQCPVLCQPLCSIHHSLAVQFILALWVVLMKSLIIIL